MEARSQEDRGVSEFAGVAILVGLTVLATASVGMYVLVADTDAGGPPQANFSFQYIRDSSVLIVTHERGDEIAARNLTIESKKANATWAALANAEPTEPIGPGATVQLSKRNAYGESVGSGQTIRVLYAPPGGNETVLDKWTGI
ncbi:MAG: type IV pilin [Haloarculaceae archaeon]